MQSNYQYRSSVVSCTPKGLVHVDASMIDAWVKDCHRDVAAMSRMIDRIKCIMRVADNCASAGYHASAVKLYYEIMDMVCNAEYRDGTMRYKRYMLDCARAVDRIERSHRGDALYSLEREIHEIYHEIYREYFATY